MERIIDSCLAFSHENRFWRLCTHERIDSHAFIKHPQSILLSLVLLKLILVAFELHRESILLAFELHRELILLLCLFFCWFF